MEIEYRHSTVGEDFSEERREVVGDYLKGLLQIEGIIHVLSVPIISKRAIYIVSEEEKVDQVRVMVDRIRAEAVAGRDAKLLGSSYVFTPEQFDTFVEQLRLKPEEEIRSLYTSQTFTI